MGNRSSSSSDEEYFEPRQFGNVPEYVNHQSRNEWNNIMDMSTSRSESDMYNPEHSEKLQFITLKVMNHKCSENCVKCLDCMLKNNMGTHDCHEFCIKCKTCKNESQMHQMPTHTAMTTHAAMCRSSDDVIPTISKIRSILEGGKKKPRRASTSEGIEVGGEIGTSDLYRLHNEFFESETPDNEWGNDDEDQEENSEEEYSERVSRAIKNLIPTRSPLDSSEEEINRVHSPVEGRRNPKYA